jgi:TPR repeat protein
VLGNALIRGPKKDDTWFKRRSRVSVLALAVLVAGCASNRYMGIPLEVGATDLAVQRLAARASTGDKQAQLDLGIRLFRGEGMNTDEGRACKLFRMAASETPGQLWIYTPSPGGGAQGRVISLRVPRAQYGLLPAFDWLSKCSK